MFIGQKYNRNKKNIVKEETVREINNSRPIG